jgi:DNA-binding Lrp family transcriptional regulator
MSKDKIMLNGSTILHLSQEHAGFFTISDPIFKILCKFRGDLKVSTILVYLQLLSLWRYGEFQADISNKELASKIGLSRSTVKREIESLQSLGLIVRTTRKSTSHKGTEFNNTSLTHPGAPEALLEALRNSKMRKPYRDKELGDITTFDEVLRTVKNKKSDQSREPEITPELISEEIKKLFEAGQVRADLYAERKVTKEVQWSIFKGHLSDKKFESDEKRLRIALRLIKDEEWSKPSGMPKVHH